MIPLFSIDETCHICHKACLDTFGGHVVHCKELTGFKYMHDFVRDVLFDIFMRTWVSVKKEASVNFLSDQLDERSTLGPIDVMVYGWVEGKTYINGFDWGFSTCKIGDYGFYVGQT